MRNLNDDIVNMAARKRRQDFVWLAILSLLVVFLFVLLTPLSWGLGLGLWLAFMGIFWGRYALVSHFAWSAPMRARVEAQIVNFDRLRAVMNALPDPVFLLDQSLLIEMANPAAEKFARAPVENQHLSQFLRAPEIRKAAERSLATGNPQMVEIEISGVPPLIFRAYLTPIGQTPMDASTQAKQSYSDRLILVLADLTQERRVEKMRSDFIANASHELRTPLASMLGFIETLRGHAKDDPEARDKFLSIMQKQAERMQRLVHDLMSLSTIELDENQPPTKSVDLCEVVSDVCDTLRPLFEKNHVQCTVINEQPDQPLNIFGYRDQLFQVIQNLIDNATKYSADAPQLEIYLGRGRPPEWGGAEAYKSGDTSARIAVGAGITLDELVYLRVCDHGPGIKREDLPRLTERFFRAEAEEQAHERGTGLGLAIVKHIINRHRGGFQIASAPQGGAAFTCFFLPFQDLEQGAAISGEGKNPR